MSEDNLLILNCDEEIALGVKLLIDSQSGCQSQATPRKNLDGSVAEWILVANLITTAIPPVLGFLKDYLKMNRVKKIKIKGVEIENPTDEQVSQVMSLLTDTKMEKS
jgi:hypothetical protein